MCSGRRRGRSPRSRGRRSGSCLLYTSGNFSALEYHHRSNLHDSFGVEVLHGELCRNVGGNHTSLFGEVVHCQGGYRHDLREEVSTGREMRHYRFRNYLYRNCENYPTHELGPIANVLDINRGNRMLTLVSVASKAAGLHEYLLREKGPDLSLIHI